MGGQPLIVALFLAGLGGSLTHCLTMCSGFVLAQAPHAQLGLARLLIPYHLGRVTTYSALGAVAGVSMHYLATWSGFALLRHLFLALAATTFLAIFAQRLLVRLGVRLPISLSLLSPVRCQLGKLMIEGPKLNMFSRYGLGLSLGLLPCPLVFAALTAASTAANPVLAAMAMTAFGAGTMPTLMALAFSNANLLKQSRKLQDGLTLAALAVNGMVLLTLAVR